MNKNKISASLIFLLIIVLIPASCFASKRIALVMGNKDYKVSPLKNPVNDANAMARVLRACNFEVIIKTNASHRTMERAIRDFGKKLEKDSTGLFYYAGHGMQVKGRNYLVPIGAQIESQGDVKFETVDAGLVLAKMEDARNALNIVILDACRNNPFSRGFRSSSPGLARMDAPTGSLVAYATAPGKLAADGDGKNGIYTKYLVQNIQKPGLTIEQVLKNVRIAVLAETGRKQTPWEASSLSGNFYFTPGKADDVESKVNTATHKQTTKARLYVTTNPHDCRVRIMNITPVFYNGIVLDPGEYHIQVAKDGYKTRELWEYIQPGKDSRISISLEKTAASIQNSEPLDINVLLARAEAEKARQEKLKREKQQKLERRKRLRQARLEKEKLRKRELEQQLDKYDLLVKNYGDKYKEQAWQAICSDFPMLTQGLKPGNTMELRVNVGLIKPGDIMTDPATGIEFVFVPGGCFQMGSSSGDSDEKPVHKVCLDSFWMGKYEVTQGQWQKIMGGNPSKFKSGDDYPVENISWNDAKEFISRLNQQSGKTFSLPSEAQWEYAARSGGKNEKYSGGSDVDKFAWYSSNSGSRTHQVGTKAPNGLGIYDMSGNVWEWCEDIYDKNAYSKHSRNNPLVLSGGSYCVFRGGSWDDFPSYVRCANRSRGSASYANFYLGFRLIRKN